jgi:glucokinase
VRRQGELTALVPPPSGITRAAADPPPPPVGTGRELFAIMRLGADSAERGASAMLAAMEAGALTEIVAVDIGGTHARFALAEIEDGRVASLGEACTLKTAEHASLQTAWEEFGRRSAARSPRRRHRLCRAGPGRGAEAHQQSLGVRPALIPEKLGVERFALVNDFGAVAHAVAQLGDEHFRHLCGPDRPLPEDGVISIVGPGTGLGVAQLLRRDGRYHVIETEGGHIDFAPLDALEDKILACLRQSYRRVSVERIAAGMGLTNIHKALVAIEGRPIQTRDEKALWAGALAGSDSLAAAAFDRFCLSLGAIAGDIALAQGAHAVVIAGGLGLRSPTTCPAPASATASSPRAGSSGAWTTCRSSSSPTPARPVRRRRRLRGKIFLMTIDAIMRTAPVIPVLVIEDAAHARPIAEALVEGGLPVLEVTLRTGAALDVIREMAACPARSSAPARC